MLILAVDTTTPSGSVALLEDDALLGEANVESAATHSARLLRSVGFLLAAPGPRLVCPLLDAKKEEIYAGLFEARQAGLAELIPQGAYGPDAFFARLPARRVIAFAGSGLPAYRAKLLLYVRDKARFPRRSSFLRAEGGRI